MTAKPQVCTAKGCYRKPVGRRLCHRHYQQAWKAGDLHTPERGKPRERARTICPPDHKHASVSTCYIQHQCRCDQCCEANRQRGIRRAKLKAYGRYDSGLVDVAPVREHMLMLAEYGLGYKHVAKVAGLGVTPVRNIVWGRQEPGPRYGELQKRVKRETAEKILAVQPNLESLAGGAKVPAWPYVRMLKALVAFGWSQSKIATELGIGVTNFDYIRRVDQAPKGKANRVQMSARTARAITELYERWSVQAPPERTPHDKSAAARSRNHARLQGWPLPMDWEAVDNNFVRMSPVRRSQHE